MTQSELLALLFRHQDEKYADFSAKLIPNIPREKFIGIRSPEYKKILKEIGDDPVRQEFMRTLPHAYHEENCLHVAFINEIRDFDGCVAELELFMPYIDNWAVNDGVNPACFRKHRAELYPLMLGWISSDAPYTAAVGCGS